MRTFGVIFGQGLDSNNRNLKMIAMSGCIGMMNEVSSNYFLYSCHNICGTNENSKKKR